MSELMTTAETCEYLKVTRPTLHKWVNHGKIPFERAGTRLRFRRTDIDTWLKGNGEGNELRQQG